MSSYKDSPKPLRKSDPNPLFTEGDDGYIVKSENALQRQRRADGTQHSFTRPSRLEAKDYDLFIGEEKLDKSVEAQATRDDIDADEVLKAYMEKGIAAPPAPRMPPVGKSEDEDEEDEEKSMAAGSKVVDTVASVVPTPNHK